MGLTQRIFNMLEDQVGVKVVGTDALIDSIISEEEAEVQRLESERCMFNSSLLGLINNQFQINKDARKSSGVEDNIFDSSRAYNGEYSREDLARIAATGGSRIYINLTATKCRAACSWIRDILQSAKFKPYSFEPSANVELPSAVVQVIEEAVDKEWGSLAEGKTEGPATAAKAQSSVREINKTKRDLKDAVMEDIQAQAKYELGKIETIIDDEMKEGEWDSALSGFIEDFTVFPTAFMKGPVITKKKTMVWENGEAEVTDKYIYKNKRVAAMDMYPSPNATTIQDGNLIEHIRMSRGELHSLIGVAEYKTEAINRVLENASVNSVSSLSRTTDIESDKAEEERRGNSEDANRDVLHGLHYFGSAPASVLKDWGMPLEGLEDTVEVQIEAILIENEIIKCIINSDPLLRRPYYKASWQNIPGSFWGRSLPSLMSSEQRMVNATARALANNMGISSGPQVELYVDRLADAGAIDEITPFKIWQMQSDPTGAGGRAITWHNIPSNAQELLAVYEKFESKADDSTGIPRYAYSNEKTGGAASTAAGLSMLLETSSKSIKDAIRHIDQGLIKPRLEYQFYWHMLAADTSYSGDVNVVVTGSSTLTVKGAEQLRRNEFLAATNNSMDSQIMGLEGRAVLLRELAKDLNLPDTVIPSSLELKKKELEMEEQRAKQAEAEAQQGNKATEAVQIQSQAQIEMHQGTLASKGVDQQLKNKEIEINAQAKKDKIRLDAIKAQAADVTNKEATASKESAQKREIALKLVKGEGI